MTVRKVGVKPLKDLVKLTSQAVWHRMVVIYGIPGSGKTFLLGTALAAGQKILVLDCDLEGAETLESLDVPFIRVDSWDLFVSVSEQLRAGPIEQLDILAIDTVSGLLETRRQEIVRDNPTVDNRQLYGQLTREMAHEIRELRKHDVLLLITAHERRNYAEDDKGNRRLIEVMPGFSPGIWEAINRITSATGRLFTRRVEDKQVRYIEFEEKAVFTGKDRTGRLPERMANPTLGKIIAALKKE